MRRVFEQPEFEQLAAAARLLAREAASYQHDLLALVEWLEATPASISGAPAASHLAAPVDAGTADLISLPGIDLLARIRQLCVNARDHRLHAEHYIESLTREAAGADGTLETLPRVLVVDDEEDVREVLAIAFGAVGFETIAAADGVEALIAAHVARPSVILMDVNMPVLNGIEATRLLRARTATRHVPVIAHTARPDLLAEPIARQFDLLVTKPAVPAAIVTAVQTLLASRGRPEPES